MGLAGILQIVKILLWGEGVFFWQDFRDGVKQNAPKCILYVGIIAVVRVVISVAENTGAVKWVTLTTYCLSAVFLLPTIVWCVLQTAFYKNGVGSTFKNALALYLKTAPATIGLTLTLLAPFCTLFISTVTVKYFVFAVTVILVLPVVILGWMCYATSVFDKYFNEIEYPQVAYKGLYRKTDDRSADYF